MRGVRKHPATSWEQDFVESMCRLKRRGFDFDSAVVLARRENVRRAPSDAQPEGRLFDPSSGRAEETRQEAMERFCFDAWHGLRPKLAGFTLNMVDEHSYTRSALETGLGTARAAA